MHATMSGNKCCSHNNTPNCDACVSYCYIREKLLLYSAFPCHSPKGTEELSIQPPSHAVTDNLPDNLPALILYFVNPGCSLSGRPTACHGRCHPLPVASTQEQVSQMATTKHQVRIARVRHCSVHPPAEITVSSSSRLLGYQLRHPLNPCLIYIHKLNGPDPHHIAFCLT
jgi:hypothetical protein